MIFNFFNYYQLSSIKIMMSVSSYIKLNVLAIKEQIKKKNLKVLIVHDKQMQQVRCI